MMKSKKSHDPGECVCGFKSEPVCAYVNTVKICGSRPQVAARTQDELDKLTDYFKERAARRPSKQK